MPKKLEKILLLPQRLRCGHAWRGGRRRSFTEVVGSGCKQEQLNDDATQKKNCFRKSPDSTRHQLGKDWKGAGITGVLHYFITLLNTAPLSRTNQSLVGTVRAMKLRCVYLKSARLTLNSEQPAPRSYSWVKSHIEIASGKKIKNNCIAAG